MVVVLMAPRAAKLEVQRASPVVARRRPLGKVRNLLAVVTRMAVKMIALILIAARALALSLAPEIGF